MGDVMFNQLNLQPAYGRDYKSKAALLVDWNEGKDFLECGTSRYINRSDFNKYCSHITSINFRYGGMRKKLVVEYELSR